MTGLIEGLELVLAVDTPHSVAMVGDLAQLAHLGTLDTLLAVALENLAALPDPAPEFIELGGVDAASDGAGPDGDGRPGGGGGTDGGETPPVVQLFEFDDYFGASRLLTLSAFVERNIGPAPHGVLAAIPDRHCLLVLVLDDSPALDRVNRLAAVADDLYRTSAGPVTPDVYFQLGDGPAEPVAHLRDDGSLYVRATERFGLGRLMGVDEGSDV